MTSDTAKERFLPLAWTAVAALLLWIYLPLVYAMAKNWWSDPNYGHGFLVPFIAAWMVWRKREQLAEVEQKPAVTGLLLVTIGILILTVGQLSHEFFLRRVSLIPVIWGLVLIQFGWRIGFMVLFPVLYLLLMIPLPYILYDSVAFPMRLLAAKLGAWGINLFGIPVLLEGNIITLPSTAMDVVDACSGIRSLVSLLAATILVVYLMLPSILLRILVVLLVAPVAIFTNGMRVMLSGVLAEKIGPQVLEGSMHDTVGWVVFMVAFAIIIAITMFLRRFSRSGEAQS